jgi:hypothetical protein
MIFLNLDKNRFNVVKIAKYCANFWSKHYRLIFLGFSLVVLSLGMYFWYQSLYQSEWSSERKNQYKKSQNKEVDLKEQEFKRVVGEVKRKEDAFKETPRSVKNIFKSYAAVQEAVAAPID